MSRMYFSHGGTRLLTFPRHSVNWRCPTVTGPGRLRCRRELRPAFPPGLKSEGVAMRDPFCFSRPPPARVSSHPSEPDQPGHFEDHGTRRGAFLLAQLVPPQVGDQVEIAPGRPDPVE